MAQMYKTEGGLLALYRGIIPTVAGVAPYVSFPLFFEWTQLILIWVGLNFMIYESIRTYFTPEGQENPSSVSKLAAGAISGAVAQTCTYPLYVYPKPQRVKV